MAATARAVDLTNVTEGGNFRPRRKPEGDYAARFVKAEDHTKEGKTPGWVMTVQIDGDARSTYPVYLNPDPKQVWKVMQACRAAGLNVRNARVKFDPNKLVGKRIGVYLEDDEYEGRPKSVIGDMFPVSEVGQNADEVEETEEIIDEEEVEEEPAPRTRRRKAAPEPEPEEEEEEEEEPAPPPRKRTTRRRQPEPEPEEDEEEEEEEPAPTRRRPVKRAAKKPPPPSDEDEDDEDLDLDDLDD